MDRREFTKYLTALGVGAGMAQIPGLVRHACAAQGKGQIPYRRLGRNSAAWRGTPARAGLLNGVFG